MKEKMQNCLMKGALQGVLTIEMSYLLPIILSVFLLVVYTVFYYHDKNILLGAASETAVLGAQLERKPDEDGQIDLPGFFQERIQGKLILFSGAQPEVSVSEDRVEVAAFASRGRMKLRIRQWAAVVEPEKKIRRKRILEDIIGAEE